VVVDVQNPGFSRLKQQPSQVHQFGLTQLQFQLSCDLSQLQVEAMATLAWTASSWFNNPWNQSSLADPWYILNWLSTRATQPTQRPTCYKYIGGQSIFNGVNLPISPSAGTINYGLFVGSGGLVLLGEGHWYLWYHGPSMCTSIIPSSDIHR